MATRGGGTFVGSKVRPNTSMATIMVFDGGLLTVEQDVECLSGFFFAFFVWLLLPRYPLLDDTFALSARMCLAAIFNLSLMYLLAIFFWTSWHKGSLFSKSCASLCSKSKAFGSSMSEALVLVRSSISSMFRITSNASCDGRQSTPGLNSFSLSKALCSASGLRSLCLMALLHLSQMLA